MYIYIDIDTYICIHTYICTCSYVCVECVCACVCVHARAQHTRGIFYCYSTCPLGYSRVRLGTPRSLPGTRR